MKTLPTLVLASVSLLTGGAALAENGNMMNSGAWGGGWMGGWMGGYGGAWLPILLVAVIVGLAVWVAKRK